MGVEYNLESLRNQLLFSATHHGFSLFFCSSATAGTNISVAFWNVRIFMKDPPVYGAHAEFDVSKRCRKWKMMMNRLKLLDEDFMLKHVEIDKNKTAWRFREIASHFVTNSDRTWGPSGYANFGTSACFLIVSVKESSIFVSLNGCSIISPCLFSIVGTIMAACVGIFVLFLWIKRSLKIGETTKTSVFKKSDSSSI